MRINEFDLRTGSYTGRRWTYRLESPSNAIGDFIAVDRGRFLVIERDNLQGDAALFKRIFMISLDGRNPFQTIEDVIVLDDRTVAVLNDNNLPFSSGRTPGAPNNNELITIRLPRKL